MGWNRKLDKRNYFARDLSLQFAKRLSLSLEILNRRCKVGKIIFSLIFLSVLVVELWMFESKKAEMARDRRACICRIVRLCLCSKVHFQAGIPTPAITFVVAGPIQRVAWVYEAEILSLELFV
jgi:hypothetical protein